MQIARIKGSVVATRKSENMTGWKLLLVRAIDLDTFEEKGSLMVAADAVGAGMGEIVMITGGSPARQTPMTDNKPCDALITAVVDSIVIKGKKIFEKHRNT